MLRTFRNFYVFIPLIGGFLQSAIYYPGANLITGEGDTAALNDDIIAANASFEDDIIDLGGLIYAYDGSSPPPVPNNDGGQSALPMIMPNGKLSIVNGAIVRSFDWTQPQCLELFIIMALTSVYSTLL